MTVAVGLRGLFLHLKLHEVEVVDIFDSQGAVGQICAHGEIGGHVSPCDDTYPNSQSDTRGFTGIMMKTTDEDAWFKTCARAQGVFSP